MNNIDEKFIRESEDFAMFRKRIMRKRRRRFIGAVILLLILAISLSVSGKEHSAEKKDPEYDIQCCIHMDMTVNEGVSVLLSDIDVKTEDADSFAGFENSSLFRDFYNAAGIKYDTIISSVYEDYTPERLYCLKSCFLKGVKTEDYLPHDYVFEFSSSGEKRIMISICPYEETLPDCVIICEEEKYSEVGNCPVMIKSFADTLYAQFENNGIYYDIKGRNITADELYFILAELIYGDTYDV